MHRTTLFSKHNRRMSQSHGCHNTTTVFLKYDVKSCSLACDWKDLRIGQTLSFLTGFKNTIIVKKKKKKGVQYVPLCADHSSTLTIVYWWVCASGSRIKFFGVAQQQRAETPTLTRVHQGLKVWKSLFLLFRRGCHQRFVSCKLDVQICFLFTFWLFELFSSSLSWLLLTSVVKCHFPLSVPRSLVLGQMFNLLCFAVI